MWWVRSIRRRSRGIPGIAAWIWPWNWEGDLLAPADGIIAFSGTVAGKSVVTIRHGRLTSTFEPAQTALPAGSRIGRGDRFATVAGESDHCGESCVHWGVRTGDERYLDPVGQAETRKIVLKPVTET